jgi:hypothetical protein
MHAVRDRRGRRGKTGRPPQRWAGAKVRLAWVMAETLRKTPSLFSGQPDRMRAMEASLFMVGYDLNCLA